EASAGRCRTSPDARTGAPRLAETGARRHGTGRRTNDERSMSTRREWCGRAGAGAAPAAVRPLTLLTGARAGAEGASTGGPLAMNASGALVRMRKIPGCGCCDKWAEHMQANGFRVESQEDPGIYEYKQQLGIPRELVSCHTAEV